MKSKYHLKKSFVLIQSTDGSIFKLYLCLKNKKIQLNVDPKSHFLWKQKIIIDTNYKKDYKTIFLKKFYFFKNKSNKSIIQW